MDNPADTYENYASFYDQIHGDRSALIKRVQDFIDSYAPKAQSILELACGTGSILAGLRSGYQLSGIDISPRMLAQARQKLAHADLRKGDIADFTLPGSFDVIFCIFNSMNHLPEFEKWEATFEHAARHLNPNGIFIFDTNTPERFRLLSLRPPTELRLVNDNYALITLKGRTDKAFDWQVRIFHHEGDSHIYTEQVHTTVARTWPLPKISTTLEKYFKIEDIQRAEGEVTNADAHRAFYVCRKQ
jgi:SAM-dependent methyltransferase